MAASSVKTTAVAVRSSTFVIDDQTPMLVCLLTTLMVLSSGFTRTGRCHLLHAARQHHYRRQAFRDLRCRPVAATGRAV
eukprot:5715250-Prymnesium_polylepis.1